MEGLSNEAKKKALNELNKQIEEELEKEENDEGNKKTILIDPPKNIINTINIYEDSIERNEKLREEEEQRQRLYEQNRINTRARMRQLKKFIKEKRGLSKNDEEFFEKYKKDFEDYKVNNFQELLFLIFNFDRENPDEVEREKREQFLEKLDVEHLNDLEIIPETKVFDNLDMSLNSDNNIIHINKSKYFKNLKNCYTVNEYNFIPNKKEYINKKAKIYEVINLDESILGTKKIQYNESELTESSNISFISYDRSPKYEIDKIENYVENGIPIDELRNRKINKILKNLYK